MTTRQEGTNLEKRIEELEVSLRIVEARAELAMELVFYLCDQLGRSDVITWSSSELKREFLTDKDYDFNDHAAAFARLDLHTDDGDAGTFVDAVNGHIGRTKQRLMLRERIAEDLRHDSDPS